MAWYECTGGSGGGGTVTIPEIITLQTSNRRAGNTLSHTFTEAGTYQYYAVIKVGDQAAHSSDFLITLNSLTLTPTVYSNSTSAYMLFYGEIIASVNDVLSAAPTATYNDTNGGLQLHVLKGADLSVFDWLGNCDNSGATFDIVNDGIALEVYFQGYHYWKNNCRSHLIAGNASPCTIYNNTSDFYYGGTFAIKVL